MEKETLKVELSQLFKETGQAHHQAFIESDGHDPEWPKWYADYLQKKLGNILNASFTQSELVYLLVLADKEHALKAPGGDWLMFYANFFIDRYI